MRFSVLRTFWRSGHLSTKGWVETRNWSPNCQPTTILPVGVLAPVPCWKLHKLSDLRLATPYSSSVYTRVRPQDKAFTFRVQLLLITRLFLIHLVSPSPLNPIEVVDKRRSNFVGIVTASHRGQIWAPKVACRPGDLSPGEYLVLPEFLHMMAVEEQWNLTGGKMEAPEGQSDDEKAFASRFANLVEISNELWDVKM